MNPGEQQHFLLARLGRLPLRAVAAFAARCARRLYTNYTHAQGILPPAWADVVQEAILVAELAASGAVPSTLSARAERAARSGDTMVQNVGADLQILAWTAVWAADAARAVALGAAPGNGADTRLARQATHPATTVCRTLLDCGDPGKVRTPRFDDLLRELDLLGKLSQGVFPNPGTTLDASDAGPLGPIWANLKLEDPGS
jgi:hypothetical protein